MVRLIGQWPQRCFAGLTLAVFMQCGSVLAADKAPLPAPAPNMTGPVPGYFYPTLDPRCRNVPMPEASLYGDTARMVPTAVCQSRGLYADSVLFW